MFQGIKKPSWCYGRGFDDRFSGVTNKNFLIYHKKEECVPRSAILGS